MSESIFRKAGDFFRDCSRDESGQSHSLKLTPLEFDAFKAILLATIVSHHFSGRKYNDSESPRIYKVGKNENDLILETNQKDFAAHLQYAPETGTLTFSSTSLPWKSLIEKFQTINSQLFDEIALPIKDDPDFVLIRCIESHKALLLGNIYVSLARVMGLDDSRIFMLPMGAAEELPYVRIPKDIYLKMRDTEMLPGIGTGKSA